MDLIAVLQKMGAIITVQTDRTIRIEGVRDLGGYNHRALSGPQRVGLLGVRGAGHPRRHLR